MDSSPFSVHVGLLTFRHSCWTHHLSAIAGFIIFRRSRWPYQLSALMLDLATFGNRWTGYFGVSWLWEFGRTEMGIYDKTFFYACCTLLVFIVSS
jgi:hypothetical protein